MIEFWMNNRGQLLLLINLKLPFLLLSVDLEQLLVQLIDVGQFETLA